MEWTTPILTSLSGKSDSGAAGPFNGAKKIPAERPRDLYCQSAAQRGHLQNCNQLKSLLFLCIINRNAAYSHKYC